MEGRILKIFLVRPCDLFIGRRVITRKGCMSKYSCREISSKHCAYIIRKSQCTMPQTRLHIHACHEFVTMEGYFLSTGAPPHWRPRCQAPSVPQSLHNPSSNLYQNGGPPCHSKHQHRLACYLSCLSCHSVGYCAGRWL